MGYTIFRIGNRVRITSGSFAGVVGVVDDPTIDVAASGTVILSGGSSMLMPVTVTASVDGQSLSLRVPPELLEKY